MSRVRITSLVLALLLPAVALTAQEGTGTISGQVVLETGGPVPGVTVAVEGQEVTQVTGRDGRFTLTGVPAGSHTVTFTLGSQVASLEGVEVVAGETTTIEQSVDWRVSFADTITVYSASREVERVVDAPAAVTVVAEQEIERKASHGQLPKLLEFTPGAEVTQSGLYDYNFNTRGFNSSLNRRVAVLVDGRNPSVPFLGAQEWAAVTFPLDDLAAAEFVRGPSAALYGANAASGVLNLITKSPRLSEGGLVRLTGGELSTFNGDLRWAGGLGAGWYAKLNGGVRNSGDFTVSRVGQAEYSQPCPPGVTGDCLPQEVVPLDPLDDNQISFGSLRFDRVFGGETLLVFEGGTASVEGPVFQTGIGRVQLVEVDRPWARANFSTEHWNAFAAYNERDAPRQTALASGTNLALDSERTQFEAQTNWDLAGGRGRIVVGASYYEEDIDSADPDTGRQTLLFAPVSFDFTAGFGQFDWELTDRLKLVLAARYDESDLFDSQFSPKGGLVWSIDDRNTVRLTYNEAFQVPNYSEFFLAANAAPPVNLSPFEGFCAPFGVSCGFDPDGNPATANTRVLAVGNEGLELEEVETIELGYNAILADKVFLSIDYYNSQNSNFITDLLPQLGTPLGRINPNFGLYQPPAALPAPAAAALLATLQAALGPSFFILSNAPDGTPILAAASYTNFGDVDTEGIDLGVNYFVTPRWTLGFTYSWFDFEIQEAAPGFEGLLLPNTPENKAAWDVSYVADRWDVGVSGRWVDDFEWFVGPFQGTVESYVTFDLVGNVELTDHIGLGLNVANLFDEEHWESFGGDLLGRRALGSVEFRW